AGQTLWYGASSIFGRFLNYLLTPLLATIFASASYGKISTLFATAAFLNIIYTYGLETAYFRFATKEAEKKVYNTALTALIVSTALFTLVLYSLRTNIAAFLEMPEHPEYIGWMIWIVALDTIAVLPFSKLRHEGRPRKFAFVKVTNILLNIALVLFFLVLCKDAAPESWLHAFYQPEIGLGYVMLANLASSAATVLLLSKELLHFRLAIDPSFMKQMLSYSWPLIIVGFGGMVNEMIDRFMLLKFYPGSPEEAYAQSGIYSANYKLAVLIILFIQAFRLGAEPFFFRQSTEKNAASTYARVMKFFVIACCFCFLGVVLFLDIWKYFMGRTHAEYWTGLKVVPILMLAKLFLGIYYNLSIWYKLTNRNLIGAWITLGGAMLTILINYLLIPSMGYMASAIATLACYGSMMIASAWLGQKYYPVAYPWKSITVYIVAILALYAAHQIMLPYLEIMWQRHVAGLLLFAAFGLLIAKTEKETLKELPVIG
ncbi:MAG: lipopolysaccharide biosynthesis protein, partial [Chitinophagaceae bacterium]